MPLDLKGQKFERLTVIERKENDKHGKTKWLCECNCGNLTIVNGSSLVKGNTKSCGCLHNELLSKITTKHGKTKSRLYGIWTGMKTRCYNENVPSFKHYGERNISVYENWIKDFIVFYDWALENGYSDNLTLDRIDVNGNYEPNNCRWATVKQQNNNTRVVIKYSYLGKEQTLSEWCEELGLRYSAVKARLYKLNWSVEKAFTAKFKNVRKDAKNTHLTTDTK